MNRYKKHTCSLREQITSTPKISNERKPIKSVGIKQRTIKRDIQSKYTNEEYILEYNLLFR